MEEERIEDEDEVAYAKERETYLRESNIHPAEGIE